MRRPKDDVLIDIETLGTKRNAVIVSIGAVIFNRADAPGTIIDSAHFKLDIENQGDRELCPSTLKWWLAEGMKDALDLAFRYPKKEQVRLGLALKRLEDFIKDHDVNICWGCGPNFDMEILQDAYEQHGVPFPVPFWKWSCVRTIEEFFYGENTRKEGKPNYIEGVAHDALHDCLMEALVIQKCYSAATRVAQNL